MSCLLGATYLFRGLISKFVSGVGAQSKWSSCIRNEGRGLELLWTDGDVLPQQLESTLEEVVDNLSGEDDDFDNVDVLHENDIELSVSNNSVKIFLPVWKKRLVRLQFIIIMEPYNAWVYLRKFFQTVMTCHVSVMLLLYGTVVKINNVNSPGVCY